MEQDEIEKSNASSEVLDQIRALCLSFPGTSERISHGSPTFFVNEKKSLCKLYWLKRIRRFILGRLMSGILAGLV